MLFIWGRNNNHLIRNNHKRTFSLPQKVQLASAIVRCACGDDFVVMVNALGELHFLIKSAVYIVRSFGGVKDVYCEENTIVVVLNDGTGAIGDFNVEKVMNSELTVSKIKVDEPIKKVAMGYGDIFMIGEQSNQDNGRVYHIKRNSWYDTKAYTDPQQIELGKERIIDVASGPSINLFLTQYGELYSSSKIEPGRVSRMLVSEKFTRIAVCDYMMGISEKGSLFIWGGSIHGQYSVPTEFGKLTKKFIDLKLSSENGFALADDGEAWVWGKNGNGQLGISDYEPRLKPFPLMTLQQSKIHQLSLGIGFTACIVSDSLQSQKRQSRLNIELKSMNFDYRQHLKPSRGTNFQLIANVPELAINNFETFEAERTKEKQHEELTYRRLADDVSVKDDQESKRESKLEKKRASSKNKHQKTDGPSDKKNSKNATPRHQRNKEFKMREEVSEKSPIQAIQKSAKPNKNKSRNSINVSIKSRESLNPHLSTARFAVLEEENIVLKGKVKERDLTITDITNKIRLLQDAIEEYQRTLTARENLMDEYQKRQRYYQIHIDQLQKSIQALINGRAMTNQQVSDDHHDYYNRMYKQLKNDFAQERDYYILKLRQYEEEFKEERELYKEKIRGLEREISNMRANERSRSRYAVRDRSNEPIFAEENKTAQSILTPGSHERVLQPCNLNMVDNVITKIEENKSRISRSANKLIQLLHN